MKSIIVADASLFCTQLRKTLDEGELQALHLARQLDCAVLIDEYTGRQVAKCCKQQGKFNPNERNNTLSQHRP